MKTEKEISFTVLIDKRANSNNPPLNNGTKCLTAADASKNNTTEPRSKRVKQAWKEAKTHIDHDNFYKTFPKTSLTRPGLHLKPFESILTELFLQEIIAQYSSFDVSPHEEYDIPDILGLNSQKRNQIRSMLHSLSILLHRQRKQDQILQIVDFGGGSGSLSIPLARNFSDSCHVTVVDLKPESLDVLHQRLGQLPPIKNLSVYQGTIQDYPHPFDIALGLHVCGSGSDVLLHKSISHNASFVVSPCCHGKLQQQVIDPYVYRATQSNTQQIAYPQSEVFRQRGRISMQEFDILCKAADRQGDVGSVLKSMLEWDRILFLREGGYHVHLVKMEKGSGMKDDVIVGWKYDHISSECQSQPIFDEEANQRIHRVQAQYIPTATATTGNPMDWTTAEETSIEKILQEFRNTSNEKRMEFPGGQGPKQRKLVHHLAERMGLRHWSEGKKNTERRVIVAK